MSNIIVFEVRYLIMWKLMTMLMEIPKKDLLIPHNSLKYKAVYVDIA